MKINTFTSMLAILFAALISYFLSSYQLEPSTKQIFGLGCFIGLVLTGISTIALTFEYNKTTSLTRTAATVFFILYLASQILFAFSSFVLPTYVLVSGSILILMLLVIYGISKANY